MLEHVLLDLGVMAVVGLLAFSSGSPILEGRWGLKDEQEAEGFCCWNQHCWQKDLGMELSPEVGAPCELPKGFKSCIGQEAGNQ